MSSHKLTYFPIAARAFPIRVALGASGWFRVRTTHRKRARSRLWAAARPVLAVVCGIDPNLVARKRARKQDGEIDKLTGAGACYLSARHAGLNFVDERIPFPEMKARKSEFPLGQLPVLHIDGKQFCQSTALSRYAAKKGGLYPVDDVKALIVDEVIASLDELMGSIPQGPAGDELKEKREAWMAGKLATYAAYFEAHLEASGGPFFLGADLSLADLWIEALVSMLAAGFFDHIPKDVLATYKRLAMLHDAVVAHPLVVAHGK